MIKYKTNLIYDEEGKDLYELVNEIICTIIDSDVV